MFAVAVHYQSEMYVRLYLFILYLYMSSEVYTRGSGECIRILTACIRLLIRR